MHVLTIRTKFTFGDRVCFDSKAQMCKGKGTIYAITVDGQGNFDYMVQAGEPNEIVIQPGILEDEIVMDV